MCVCWVPQHRGAALQSPGEGAGLRQLRQLSVKATRVALPWHARAPPPLVRSISRQPAGRAILAACAGAVPLTRRLCPPGTKKDLPDTRPANHARQRRLLVPHERNRHPPPLGECAPHASGVVFATRRPGGHPSSPTLRDPTQFTHPDNHAAAAGRLGRKARCHVHLRLQERHFAAACRLLSESTEGCWL